MCISSAEHIKPLASMLNAALSGRMSFHTKIPSGPEEHLDNKSDPSPGESSSTEILGFDSDHLVIGEIGWLALRLATEGFLEPSNELLVALFSAFPHGVSEFNPLAKRALEFIWASAGMRPQVPWETPNEEQLKEWEQDVLENCGYPPTREEEEEVLETLRERSKYGDLQLELNYSFYAPINLALKHGFDEDARAWLDIAFVLL